MERILSVVIPSYNTEKYIIDCTATMLDSRVLDDVEILIVNDGSKDNTGSLADELVNRYPGTVRHIDKENGGHGSTINRGIKEAVGKYFRVIDGDDWVDTEEFVKYVSALKSINEDVVLTNFERVFDSDKSKVKISIGVNEGKYNFDEICLDISESYQLHSVTFKTEIMKKIIAIREHCFYVDQEYISYPLQFINTAYVLNNTVYQYRIGINEQSMSEKNMVKNRKMHELVIFDLIDYYKKGQLSSAKEELLFVRTSNMAARQFRIYLKMEDAKLGSNECKAYNAALKNVAPDICKRLPGKKAKLLNITNGMLYGLLRSR